MFTQFDFCIFFKWVGEKPLNTFMIILLDVLIKNEEVKWQKAARLEGMFV